MKKHLLVLSLTILLINGLFDKSASQSSNAEVDVCIYGGTSAGVMAAVAARRMGKSVMMIEPKKHIGGLTSGGLGQTDIGKKFAIYGLARDFYRRAGKQYGQFESWYFEPHVAEEIFKAYLKEEQIEVLYAYWLHSVKKNGNRMEEIQVENASGPSLQTNRRIRAKMFIDASYEGDLMARAGVSYTFGREANQVYKETKNGVQPSDRHQVPFGVDPYKIEGDPKSGLIFGINPMSMAEIGSGDKKIQAYCFRLCLTTDPANQLPITRPTGYDSSRYELLSRILKKMPKATLNDVFIISPMPNNKTDMNSRAGQSSDYHMGNWDYPDGDYKTRQAIWEDHENYTKGMLYFLGHDARVAPAIRQEMLTYGYPKDEYTDNGGFTHELYVREARRMLGEYVMTEQNCMSNVTVPDGIAFGSYNMDSHHTQSIIWNGFVRNEGEVTVHLPKEYPIAYRSITPKQAQCSNLLVPVCLSASHIAYGSIRMEPVFMELGQSAGMAAAMAIDGKVAVQKIDVKALQQKLRLDPYLNKGMPDIHIPATDSLLVSREGNWLPRTEMGYDFTEPYSFSPGGRGRLRLKYTLPIKTSGTYGVYLYNPYHDDIQDGDIPVEIIHDKGKTAVKINMNKVERLNGRMWDLGTYSFKAGGKYVVELIGDDVIVPIQAGNLLLVPVAQE